MNADQANTHRAACSYEYDAEVDALYVYLRPELTIARTIQLDDLECCGTNVDVDADGAPVGYEVLSPASIEGRTWFLATLARSVPKLDDCEMAYVAWLSAQHWSDIRRGITNRGAGGTT